jgi:uncharacterized protein YceK
VKKIILLLMLVLCLAGCKKKVDHDRERRGEAPVQSETRTSQDEVVWTVTTIKGTYQGHKIEIESNNLLNFVTDDGKKVYTTAPWQMEAQSK